MRDEIVTLSADQAAIRTDNLSKRFGDNWAVRGLSLTVPRGQIFGFLGPNGAGKTTTIRMLLGLVRPSRGSAEVLGQPMPQRRVQVLRTVGAMVEEPAFYDFLSGRRNLELLAAMSGGAGAPRIEEVLQTVGLADRQHDKVGHYSHGMRQRLGLAQALLPRPELLILDEPANGLDPKGLREVRQLIRRLGEQEGATVFLSSHLLSEVEQICTHVGVILRGRLVAHGEVSEILAQLAGRAEIWVDRPAEALAALTGAGYTADMSDEAGRFTVQAPPECLSDINALLVGRGLKVSALIPERQTLEDFYMSAQEADGRADGPEA